MFLGLAQPNMGIRDAQQSLWLEPGFGGPTAPPVSMSCLWPTIFVPVNVSTDISFLTPLMGASSSALTSILLTQSLLCHINHLTGKSQRRMGLPLNDSGPNRTDSKYLPFGSAPPVSLLFE